MKVIKKQFVLAGLVAVIGAMVCFLLMSMQGYRPVYIITGLALAVLAFMCWFHAMKEKPQDSVVEEAIEERDELIAKKSRNTALRVFNYVAFAAGIVCVVCYAITKVNTFLIVGATLLVVVFALLAAVLIASVYYESHM